jgi:sulfur-oxidizing protein SoxY
MFPGRRRLLIQLGRTGLAALTLASGLVPRLARAVEARPAFTAAGITDALKALGIANPAQSEAIHFRAPDIAENGAAVPVEVESALPGTREILLLVEKNPHVMSASFSFPDGTDAYVATRVKVAESSLIHAVIRTDAGAFYNAKLVKVTLGGCGG